MKIWQELKSYWMRQLSKGNITQARYDYIMDWIEKQELKP